MVAVVLPLKALRNTVKKYYYMDDVPSGCVDHLVALSLCRKLKCMTWFL